MGERGTALITQHPNLLLVRSESWLQTFCNRGLVPCSEPVLEQPGLAQRRVLRQKGLPQLLPLRKRVEV